MPKRLTYEEEARKFYLNSPCIAIRVGEGYKMQKFPVHQDLLTSRSLFFAKALIGSWKEAEDHVVGLPKGEPSIFALYVQCLYNGSFPLRETITPTEEDPSPKIVEVSGEATLAEPVMSKASKEREEQVKSEHNALSALYVLCEKIQDTTSKNIIIDAMIDSSSKNKGCVDFFFPNCQPSIRSTTRPWRLVQ